MSNPNQRKRAIVLAGSASHGAYHVGVIRALFGGKSAGTGHKPLKPDIVAGISAGAFNAATLLSQIEAGDCAPADFLEDVWLKRLAESKKRGGNGVFRFRGDPSEFLNPLDLPTPQGPLEPLRRSLEDVGFLSRKGFGRGRKFLKSTDSLHRRFMEQVNLSSFVSMKPFKKSIRKSIHFERLRQSKERTLLIGAVDWKSGIMRYFEKDEMSDELGPEIIRASAAVPGIFPRVKVDNKWYCDGAAVENTPLSGAIDANAAEVHFVTSAPPVNRIPAHKWPNTFDTLYRFLVIRESATLEQDLKVANAVNQSLLLMERPQQEEEESLGSDALAFTRIARRISRRIKNKSPYRKVVVHVYHPPRSLGDILDLLNFDRKFLSDMIQKGYDDTLSHDCKSSGCVLLEQPMV